MRKEEIFDSQIGLKAKKYYDTLYHKIPDLLKSCRDPDEVLVTVALSNSDECIYTLDDLKKGLKRCSSIDNVIFRLNGFEMIFPIYGSYVNKYDRLRHIKEFCAGKNIVVKMKWSCIGLSRELYKIKWSKVSYDTYLERIDSMPFFCEPIYLWKGRYKRQVLVSEVFSYTESINDFKDRLLILENRINNLSVIAHLRNLIIH